MKDAAGTPAGRTVAVAIDGPSGAGKSSVAKAAAERFGFRYVDTGAIYRTVGLAARRAGLDSWDAAGVIALLPALEIGLEYGPDGSQVMRLAGEDVSREIRTEKSSIYASDVSKLPEVRDFLMEMQRAAARRHSVIMDGRDIGTVVLPSADVKIFLTASAEARARRRCAQLQARGDSAPYEEVLRDINYRDAQDSSRAAAPLRPAEDAVVVDTSAIGFEESVEAVCGIIRRRLGL